MLRKFIITVICCLSISVLCAVPSYAATMSDKEMAIEQISLCWQTSTNKKNVISFDSLTSLCADLNRDGYPCEIRFVSVLNGYAILGTGYVHNTFESARVYSLSGKYYSNIEGSIFYSPYQSDSLLSGISTYLSAISSKVSTISDTLSSFQSNTQNALVKIYSKLSGISDSVSTGVSHLNSINNYLSGDLTAYLQSIESSVLGANTSLGQLSTKMDSVVSTLTTENGKNSLFYPITRRLDSIISSLGSSSVNTGSLRYWRVSDDSIGSLNFSNIGYDALSSLMETVTESYLDYQVVSGDTRYYLDSVDSFSIVHTTVGNTTGYFIQCVGKYRQSVNGINQFFDGVFYLTEKNSTIFYASDDSRNSSFDDSNIISKLTAIVSGLDSIGGRVSDLSNDVTQLFGEYDSTYEFPVVNANSYGLVYGVKSSIFADVPENSSLFYSPSSHVIAREWRGTSSGGAYSGNAAETYCSGANYLYTEKVSGVSDSSSIQSVVRNISLNTWDGNLLTFSDVSCSVILQSNSFYAIAVITPKWDDSGAWLGWYSDSTLLSTANEPATKLLNSPPSLGDYYIFSDTADPLPVVYSTRFTSFLQGQFTSILNAIGSSGDSSSVNLSTIESTLSSINDKLDNLGSSSGSSDNSDVVAAINSVSTKMTDLFGLHDTTYEFPSFRDVFAESTSGRVYGVKSSLFNEIPTAPNEGLYYSSYSYLNNPFYNGGSSSGGSYSGHPYTVSVTASGTFFYQYLETFEMSASSASSLPKTVTRNISGKLIHGVYFTVNNVECPVSYAEGYATVKCSFFTGESNGKPVIMTSSFKTYNFSSDVSLPDLNAKPPASGDCYIYAASPGMAVPVVSPNRFTNFLELQFSRLINAVASDGSSSVGNSGLISAITSVGNKISNLFGQYDSTFEFPALDSASSSSVTRLYGVKSSLFADVPDSENLVYSFSDSIKVRNWEGVSSGGDYAGYLASCRPVGSSFYYSEVIPNASALSSVRHLSRNISFYYYSGSLSSFSSVQCDAIFKDGFLYVTCTIEPRWNDNGKFRGWYSGDFSLTTLATDPGYRFFSSPPASDDYYIYSLSAATSPVVYATRFTAFTELQTNRIVNAVGSSSGGSGSADLISVTTRLDTIIEQLQTTSGESGCDHTYTQDVTQAPTCILPGLQVSTCSQCGDSYSEILAALGHDWQCTSHVEAVTDPDTGEVTQSGYDIYTCSRCGDTYNDYAGDGAPSDYGDTSLSKIIVKLFSKLGTFAGKIISWIIGLFDKMLSGLNDIITRFSDLTAQITGFGGDYPSWLSGFWGILPQEFQLALTFSFVCVFIGVIGRKLFFA